MVKPPIRATLFDSFSESGSKNLYCNLKDLHNEASVETFFAARLLKDLGYKDSQIEPKKSISSIVVALGHRKVNYKPDFVLKAKRLPRWVLDAKGTDERLEDWELQCSGYCLELNKRSKGKPVQYYVLTNGLRTLLYKWDEAKPILELVFGDFTAGNPKYEMFRQILSPDVVGKGQPASSTVSHDFRFERPSPEVARRIFAQCHRIIWKSEGYGVAPAFREFVKVMFVKLWADKKLREDPEAKQLLGGGKTVVKLPHASFSFSIQWIESREEETENPLSDILFKPLRDIIEKDIQFKKKKRIFSQDETINLRPDTIKSVVQRLQHYDMFGIDEDLNGRLFETFLSATMRGKELGQFFTPRSIVKLMSQLAQLRASPAKIDTVVDACCGSGGFLIEALSDMRNKLRENEGLSPKQRDELIEKLSNECVFGIDFAKDPPLARIARINMYLHGDGGSRIYFADSLDKELKPLRGADAETIENQEELRSLLESRVRFDIALTNPPFSMTKQAAVENELAILKQYNLAYAKPGSTRMRSSLRSSAMYIERYRDLLKPGGKLLTVIDDTVLASQKFAYVRDFIRENFIIRAIVSLPGDAFRRQGSRVKTSVLLLEKKEKQDDSQPAAFAAFSERLGVDDLTPKASEAEIHEARDRAEAEIKAIVGDFLSYLRGSKEVLTIPPSRLQDRLDLKRIAILPGRLTPKWKTAGIEVKKLGEVAELAGEEVDPRQAPEELFRVLKVTYDGNCEIQFVRLGKEIKPEKMTRVRAGHLVFSNIRATDGAVGVVPFEMDGGVVSASFTVLTCATLLDTVYLWMILRTHEIRADLQAPSTGTGRYTTDWKDAQEVTIPWLQEGKRKEVAQRFLDAWELAKKKGYLEQESLSIARELGLESEESQRRWRASKAPK